MIRLDNTYPRTILDTWRDGGPNSSLMISGPGSLRQPNSSCPYFGASVSSPTVRFCRPGSELQVVKREGAWFEVLDPVTQERWWVLDRYLSSIASSTPTQVATESTTEPQPAKPAPPKANKLQHRSAKLPVRGRVVLANADHPFGNWAQGR